MSSNLKFTFLLFSSIYFTSFLARSAVSKGPNPSFIKQINLEVGGDDECVQTSEYIKPKKGQPCKNLGNCYQYRCGAVARHCSECGERKGPCIEYPSSNEPSRSKRSNDVTSPPALADFQSFLESIRSRMRRLAAQVQGVVNKPTVAKTVPVETLGNAIVHIRAGLKNCTGFLTAVNGPNGKRHLIVTAAQCLINFETECRSSLETFGSKFTADPSTTSSVDGYTTYLYNHSWPCFGDYDSEVTKVKKYFRSYVVIVTSYKGERFTIPLTTKHVIVPRDYMDCQDCRYDFAAIKIEDEDAQEMLRGHQPFILAPGRNPMEWTGQLVTQIVAVTNSHRPKILRKAADTKFCTVSYATNEKLCFKLPISPNVETPPELLPGSPLFVSQENADGQTEYHCIGIFTGTYKILDENLSTDDLMLDRIEAPPIDDQFSAFVRYYQNGAVRITENLVSLLEKLSGNPMMRVTVEGNTSLVTQVYPDRRECFPNILDPYDGNRHLYLCSLGWKDEKGNCVEPGVKLSRGCTWDGKALECTPRIGRNAITTGDPQESIFQQLIIPGTTRRLSLRGQKISNLRELATVLRNLPELEDLLLDYNDITSITSSLFFKNAKLEFVSLDHNKIKKLRGDMFWRNPKLRHISIAQNHIRSLPDDSLIRATQLEYFNAESNHIPFISQNLFRRNRKLRRIFLGFNNISYLAGKFLHGQVGLEEFQINNNKIARITNGLFILNRKLTLVDFSYNKLTGVARNTFDTNPELLYVNLDYNLITAIPYRLFSNQQKLIAVNASQNPLTQPTKIKTYFQNTGVPYS